MMTGTKSWYISKLKENGVGNYEGKNLKQYKTHQLATLYHNLHKINQTH